MDMKKQPDVRPCASPVSADTSVALITGASSGIGLEFACQLAGRGWAVWLVSNDAAGLARAAEKIRGLSAAGCHTTCLDLSLEEAADSLYRESVERAFRVDLLINDAGIFSFSDVTAVSEQKLRCMLHLHVLTLTRLCRLFGRDMRQRGGGYILNLSSLSAWLPFPGIALYAATKAYVRTFSKAFAQEMKPFGVRVLCLCPGGVATGLYGLPPHLLRLGVRLGILLTPERLVRRSLRRLLRKRGLKPVQYVPGWINRLFIPIYALCPPVLLRRLKKSLSRFEK